MKRPYSHLGSLHRSRTRARRRPTRLRLGLEALERRQLLATVQWISSSSGNWDVGSDWSTGQVPGPGDDAVIAVSGIAVTIDSGQQSVHSLACSEPLSITGGSLTVAANSTISGGLTMTGGSLTASGSGVTLAVTGATTVSAASLYAQNGATLSLPNLSSYANPNGSGPTYFEATGVGSSLALVHLSTVGVLQRQHYWNLEANQGGSLSLPALTSIVSSSGTYDDVQISADGSGSTLNLSNLTTLSTTDDSTLAATNQATLQDDKLTNLNGINVTLDGTATIATSQWGTLTNGSLIVTGGSYSLGLTNVDGSNVSAQSGGSLALPNLTSYAANVTGFTAVGAGSVLDVSALTEVTQATQNGDFYTEATSGGTLNLTGLTSLDVSTDFFYDTGHSTLLDSNLSSLNGVEANLDGTDKQVANSWKKLTNGSLSVGPGSYTLPGLTDVDGSYLGVGNSGTLALPGVTSDAVNNGTFEADGTGVLDLPALATVTQQGAWNIKADGGTVNLTGLAGLTAQPDITVGNGGNVAIGNAVVTMPVSGSGATINVPQLPQGSVVNLGTNGSFTGGTTFNITASDTVFITGFDNGYNNTAGTFTGGVVFNVGAGATVDTTGGAIITYGGTLTGSGSGTVVLSSGQLNVALGGLTLNFPESMFQWTGGVINSSKGDVTNLGNLVLAGNDDKYFWDDGTLDNFGTIVQSGSGNLNLHSDSVTATTLKIEPGASFVIESDSGIDNDYGGTTAVINAGRIAKTAGSGTSTLLVNGQIANTGTIEADSGTLFLDANTISQVASNTLTAGTWNALNGATIQFPSGTSITANEAKVSLGGSGATIAALAGLVSNSGIFSLTKGADFTTAGNFSNSGGLTAGAGSILTVRGNYTQATAGTLNVQIGGTPASSQFGKVAVTGMATLAGALSLALVNGFTASVDQDFKAMTFAGASGTFSTVNLDSSFTEAINSTSLDLHSTVVNPTDLSLSNVDAPTAATAGQQITVTWQVTNQSTNNATGVWQDSVYLSPTPTITSNSILLGAAQHSGGLSANGSYSSSLMATVPAVAAGLYSVLIQADSLYRVSDPNRANNTLAATSKLNVSEPALALGTPSEWLIHRRQSRHVFWDHSANQRCGQSSRLQAVEPPLQAGPSLYT